MEKLSKILSVGVLGMFLLTACSNPFAKPAEPSAPANVKTTVDVVSDASSVKEVSQENEKQEPSGEVQMNVSRYGKNLKCSLIKDEETRQLCDMQINDMIGNMLEREIVSTFDASRCKELPEAITQACEAKLSEAGVKGPVSKEELALFNQILRGQAPEVTEENEELSLYPEYDKTQCAQLKTMGYQAYCEKQIEERVQRVLFDQIVQSDDSSRCDELTQESNIRDCQLFFGLEVAEEPEAM